MSRSHPRILALALLLGLLSGACNSTTRIDGLFAKKPLPEETVSGLGTGLSNGPGTQGSDNASAGGHGASSTGSSDGTSLNTAGSGSHGRAIDTTSTSGTNLPTTGEIRVGWIFPASVQELGAALGFQAPKTGDAPKQAQNFANWLNSTGGIAGRKVKHFVVEHRIEDAARDLEERICTDLVQDKRVEAVVLQAMLHEATRDCYTKKGVIAFEPAPFPMDNDMFNGSRLSGLYWSPSYPSIDRAHSALIPHAKSKGFFDAGSSWGVLAFDMPVYRRVLDNTIKPVAASNGLTIRDIAFVDPSDAGTIERDLNSVIVRWRGLGINRVTFLGGAPLAPFFMLNAGSQGYNPRVAVTTFDNPRFAESGSAEAARGLLEGAVGIGWNPAGDVSDPQFPFPSSELKHEKACIDAAAGPDAWPAQAAGGSRPDQRAAARPILSVCESMLLLRAGATNIEGKMTGKAWSSAAKSLGTSYDSATSFDTTFGPSRHDGASAYRPLAYFGDCDCFRYTGPSVGF